MESFGRDGRNGSREERAPRLADLVQGDIESAHKKARRVLEMPTYKVSPSQFEKKYGKDVVERDTASAMERRAEYEKARSAEQQEAYVLAEIFEAILLTEGQESGWLGDDVKILKTTDYDDLINHTDLIAEWHSNRPDAHSLGLAVDVTFGPATLEKKFSVLQEKIDKGSLGNIKYAHSEQKDVPHVVIGMSKETVHELMRLWTDEDYEALAAHPIQRIVLEQIYSQLYAISEYAKATGKSRVAEAYKKPLEAIRPLLLAKNGISLERMETDRVSAGITAQIQKRFSQKKI